MQVEAGTDALYGYSPVAAALHAGRRSVQTLYVQESGALLLCSAFWTCCLSRGAAATMWNLQLPGLKRCFGPNVVNGTLTNAGWVIAPLQSNCYLSTCGQLRPHEQHAIKGESQSPPVAGTSGGEKDAKRQRQHGELAAMAKSKGAAVQTVDKHTLNQLSGNRPHQVPSRPSA